MYRLTDNQIYRLKDRQTNKWQMDSQRDMDILINISMVSGQTNRWMVAGQAN